MLPITDLAQNTELLTNISGIKRKRKVNGEKSLAFFVVPDESNEHAFGMVDVESIVEFDGEEYVIKVVNEKNVGLRSIKEVNAVHKFFCDMIDSYKYEKHTGSMTFASALQFVFADTGYTPVIVDEFYAQDFDNFGDDNRLALLQKVLERYGAEFYVEGNLVNFKRQIGNNTDFQFRYAHNVKTIDMQIETQNLATYIKGYGKQNDDGTYVVEAEYTSPNAAVLGIRHAPAVRDERYTTEAGLLERLQNDLVDEPQMSIKIDFADLRASGYLYAQPGEGDYGYIIYEPMGLDVEARIVEVDEEFNADLQPIKADVTLSNIREGLADVLTRFEQTSKEFDRIMDGREQLPYTALDEAVRLATEALQSAQTELEFNNGIIAREKDDPNRLVVFNSAGIGISTDGGNEFKTAMTAGGVVAERIIGSAIIGVNLASANNLGMFHVSGSDAEFVDTVNDRTVKISPDGIFGYNPGGAERFRMDRLLVTSAALGTSNSNVYLAPDANNEARIVDVNSIPSDGVAENYSYRPIRVLGMRFAPGANGYIGTEGEVRITSSGFVQEDDTVIYRNVHAAGYIGGFIQSDPEYNIYAGTDGEFRVTSRGMGADNPIIYRDIRAGHIWTTGLISSQSGNMYVGSDDEVRITARSGYNEGSTIYRNLRANGLIANALDIHNGTHLYLRPASGGVAKVTTTGTLDTYADIYYKTAYPQSQASSKTNIHEWDIDGETSLALLSDLNVRGYYYQSSVDEGNFYEPKIGMLAEELPIYFRNAEATGADPYSVASFLVRICQIQQKEIENQKVRISDFDILTGAMSDKIADLEQRILHLEMMGVG